MATQNKTKKLAKYKGRISTSAKNLKKSLLTVAITQGLICSPVQAAFIIVTSGGDEGIQCTLREAVESINAGSLGSTGCSNLGGGAFGVNDIISIPTNLGTMTLTQGPLSIENDVEISGANNGSSVIRRRLDNFSDSFNGSLIKILPGGHDVTFKSLNFTGGAVNGSIKGISVNVDESNLTIIDSHISGGRGGPGGGGIFIDNGVVVIEDSIISNNSTASGGGGAILAEEYSSLTVVNSRIYENTAGLGGGIALDFNSTAKIETTTIFDNSASSGGGISIQRGSDLTVNQSLIEGNITSDDAAGVRIFSFSNAVLSNSTISGNSAANNGGGIYVRESSVSIVNTTVANNSATSGDGLFSPTGDLLLSNSIIANPGSSNDCQIGFATVTANRNNIIQDGSCDTSAMSVDPMLGPLNDNGGATFTHALLTNSPAVGAGSNAICSASPINDLDQRGEPRANPEGSLCDLGAFESPEGPADISTFFVIPIKNRKAVVFEL